MESSNDIRGIRQQDYDKVNSSNPNDILIFDDYHKANKLTNFIVTNTMNRNTLGIQQENQ